MGTKDAKRRLGDLRWLMESVEEAVRGGGAWSESPSEAVVRDMFVLGGPAIALPTVTSRKRKRRNNQLDWKTVAKELRLGAS